MGDNNKMNDSASSSFLASPGSNNQVPFSGMADNNTEPLEIQTASSLMEAEADFVKCTPSPHTSALSHLRRSSVSSGGQQSRAVNSIAYEHLDTSCGTARGSAKKVRLCE